MKNVTIKLFAILAVFTSSTALAGLVHFDPIGPQVSGTSISASFTDAGVTSSSLSQVGFEDYWNNFNRWPVGRISSGGFNSNQYLTFTVDSAVGTALDFDSLTYDKESYFGLGPTSASIRSSMDSFLTDIDTISVNAAGFQTLSFDLTSLARTSAPVEFRLYFYAAAENLVDWADLLSSAAGRNGLVLQGVVVSEPSIIALLGIGILGLTLVRRRMPS